jgi:hypothetical protein
MTLPNERTRAVRYARELLYALLDPKLTPRVPRKVREQALRVLRHFPNDCDLYVAGEAAPNVFSGKRDNDT